MSLLKLEAINPDATNIGIVHTILPVKKAIIYVGVSTINPCIKATLKLLKRLYTLGLYDDEKGAFLALKGRF